MSTGAPWTSASSATICCLVVGQPLRPAARSARRARRPRSARPAPAPSRAPGRSGCRGCRARRRVRDGERPSSSTLPVARSSVSPSSLRARVAGLVGEHLERHREREELAERVPAQMVLATELLHVLGRRAAGAGLEQAAAVHQRHDREHLRAGAELEDREQIGQVVAQDVAGDRDRVLAGAGAREREAGRLGDVGRISICSPSVSSCVERRADLASAARASWARVSSSQNTAGAPVARARRDRERDPVADRRRPWSGTRARCRRPRPRARAASSPSASTTRTRPGVGDLERLVVRAVLLGRLRHQADVRRRAHRRRIERAVAPAVVDGLGVQRRVGVVGDHELACPAARRRAFHIWPEARIAAGIEASMITSLGTCRLVIPRSESTIASAGPSRRRRRSPRRRRRARPRAAGRARRAARRARRSALTPAAASASPCSANRSAKYARTAWPKMIGSDTFIIVAFRCTENSTPCRAWRRRSARRGTRRSAARAHHRGVDDLARRAPGSRACSTVTVPSAPTCSIRTVAVGGDRHRLLGGAEVAVAHRRHVRRRLRRPGAHRVRVLARVGLDRRGRAAVGVALAQHRVDGAALDPVVARADVALLVGRRDRPGSRGSRSPASCSSAIAAFSCGTEALMFGSLMMFASGVCGELAELGERVGDALLGRRAGPGTGRGSARPARCRAARSRRRRRRRTPARSAAATAVASAGRLVGVGVDDLHATRGPYLLRPPDRVMPGQRADEILVAAGCSSFAYTPICKR